MTRKEFLNLTFPTLPYCEFKEEFMPYRGSSTSFSESIHQKSPCGNCLNFWLDTEFNADFGEIVVSFYNASEKNPDKQLKNVFSGNTISKKEIQELYRKYLVR